MMCFDISAISGMSCIAWRSEAAASANDRSSCIFSALGLTLQIVRAGRVGGLLGIDLGDVLQRRLRRRAVLLDDAVVAHLLHAEGLAHRAGDDLQLLLVLRGERDQHHEEAHHQRHKIGERHEPAVTSSVAASLLRHDAALSGHSAVKPVPARLRPRDASPADRRAAFRARASGSWSRGSSGCRR